MNEGLRSLRVFNVGKHSFPYSSRCIPKIQRLVSLATFPENTSCVETTHSIVGAGERGEMFYLPAR